MNAKKLLPLIVILAVLGGLTVMKNSAKKTPTLIEQANLESVISEGLQVDDLARIELFAGAKPDESVVLEKEGDAWRVTSHFNAPVKDDALTPYIEKLVKFKGEFRAEADGEDALSAWNLKDDEAFHVRAFKSGDDTPVVDLRMGKSPKYGAVFFRKAGGLRVYEEAVNLRQEAGVYGDEPDKAPTADKWLNKEILKLEKDAFTKVALTMPDKTLTFEKKQKEVPPPEPTEEGEVEGETPSLPVEYEWLLASGGAEERHKQPGLDKILNKLAALSASDIVDPAKAAEYGFDAPAFKVVLSREGDEDVVLEGARLNPAGDAYLRLASAGNGMIYRMDKYGFDQIFPKGSDLFVLPRMDINANAVSHIELEGPEGRIVAAKTGDAWVVLEPATTLNVQESVLSGMATAVAALAPMDYVDPGVETGAFTTTLSVTTDKGVRTIAFGGAAKTHEGSYVKLDGADGVLVLAKASAEKLFLSSRDIFEMTLLDINEADVVSMEITEKGSAKKLIRSGEEAWTLEENGASKPADFDACEDLLSDIATLQAADFSTAAFPAPTLSLNLMMGDGIVHQVNIACADNCLVQVDGGNVLSIDKATLEGLKSQLNGLEKKEAAVPAVTEDTPFSVVPVEGAATTK
jgi:hypothetical protein